MKKTLIAALLALAPAAALAAPVEEPTESFEAVTGAVRITPILCIRAPCPPIVEVVSKDGTSVAIRGPMLRDVESLRGKEITVKGRLSSDGVMNVTGVVPGRSKEFVTGVVKDTTVCDRMVPPSCRYSVEIHTPDGGVVRVTDEKYAEGLAKLDGATVSIKGTVTNTPCPPGRICIQLYQPTLWPHPKANIWVKGELSPAYHIALYQPGVELSKYFLGFPNGNALPVFTGKNWNDRVERDAWFAGRFDGEKFRATRAGYPVVPDPIVEPIFPWTGTGPTSGGANVTRAADTDGEAVAAGGEAATGEAAAAGMLRD